MNEKNEKQMKALTCIYDKLAEKYTPPTMTQNLAVAKRLFRNELKKHDALTQREFELRHVGWFDEHTAFIIPTDKPEIVTDWTEVKKFDDLTDIKK